MTPWGGITPISSMRAAAKYLALHIGSYVGGYSSPPIAADGRICIASELGEIFTIRAGRDFEIRAKSLLKKTTMATPALAKDTLFVRTESAVWAVAESNRLPDPCRESHADGAQ